VLFLLIGVVERLVLPPHAVEQSSFGKNDHAGAGC